jgi:hypothetical protein
MEITVVIKEVLEKQVFTSAKNGQTYEKFGFVGETQSQYPKTIKFDVMGDRAAGVMTNVVVGNTVAVSFDISSRLWNSKYYTECQAWRTQRVDGTQEQTQQATTQTTQQPATAPAQKPFPENNGGDGDGEQKNDLPF